MIRRKITFEYDAYPDYSWLEQDIYDPNHRDYSPGYRTQEDASIGHNPIDPEWYRNPENHVTLAMVVYEMANDDDDWRIVDSLTGIDFLVDSDDWTVGTFYHVSELPDGYLRELARDAGLPE